MYQTSFAENHALGTSERFKSHSAVLAYIIGKIQDGSLDALFLEQKRPLPAAMRITREQLALINVHIGMLQKEVLKHVGITAALDPAHAAHFVKEGHGIRLHTHPAATLPAEMVHEQELLLVVMEEERFTQTVLVELTQSIVEENNAVGASLPTKLSLGLQAKFTLLELLYLLVGGCTLSDPDFIHAKLLKYFTTNGQEDLIGHVRCKRNGCETMLPSIDIGHCLLCGPCWALLKEKMLEEGVQPADRDVAVLGKLLEKSAQIQTAYPGMHTFLTTFDDGCRHDGQPNLLTLANNMFCGCQGNCWVRLVSTVMPEIAEFYLDKRPILPYEPGAIEVWWTHADPTSQYDPRLNAVHGLRADMACTAIACVAALHACGANGAAEKMSNLTDSAHTMWANSIKCGAYVYQDIERAHIPGENRATGVRETLPLVGTHLGVPRDQLGQNIDCIFDYPMSLQNGTDYAAAPFEIAYDDTNERTLARSAFVGLNDGDAPLTFPGRVGLGSFLALCLQSAPAPPADARLAIILTHSSTLRETVGTTYLLVRNGDSTVVFRDSHVQMQWEFKDAAAFGRWFEHAWTKDKYFVFVPGDQTKPKDAVDVTVFRQSKVRVFATTLFHFVEHRNRFVADYVQNGTFTEGDALTILKKAGNDFKVADFIKYCTHYLSFTADEALKFVADANSDLEEAEDMADLAAAAAVPTSPTFPPVGFFVVLRTPSGTTSEVELPTGADTSIASIHDICYEKFSWDRAAPGSLGGLVLQAETAKLEIVDAGGKSLSLKDHAVTESKSKILVMQQAQAGPPLQPAGDTSTGGGVCADTDADSGADSSGGGVEEVAAAVTAAKAAAAKQPAPTAVLSGFASRRAWSTLRNVFVPSLTRRQRIWNPTADGQRLQDIVNGLFATLDQDGNGKIEMADFTKLIAGDPATTTCDAGFVPELVNRLWTKVKAVATASKDFAANGGAVLLLPGAGVRMDANLSAAGEEVAAITPEMFSSALIFLAINKTPRRISMAFPAASSVPSTPLTPLGRAGTPGTPLENAAGVFGVFNELVVGVGGGGGDSLAGNSAADANVAALDCTVRDYFARAELMENPPGALLLGESIERWCKSLQSELVDSPFGSGEEQLGTYLLKQTEAAGGGGGGGGGGGSA